MKKAFKLSAFLLIGFAMITGCEKKPAKSALDRFNESLTTEDLARLMHLHAIKLIVPPSQQPFQQIRIVFIKPDGTIVPKGGVAVAGKTNDPTCKILLGYRIDGETFSGRIECQTSGLSESGDFSFTDAFANRVRAFGIGTFYNPSMKGPTLSFEEAGLWKNGFVGLASDEGMDGTSNTNGTTILAIQLVK